MYPDDILKAIDGKRDLSENFLKRSLKKINSKFSFHNKMSNDRKMLGGFLVLVFAASSIVLANRIISPIGNALRSRAASQDVKILGNLESNIALSKNNKIRVIVQFANVTQIDAKISEKQRTLQRDYIKSKQNDVATKIKGTQSKVLNTYLSIPFMALEVDADGLSKLKEMKGIVSSVSEDTPIYDNLKEARVIEGADVFQSQYNGAGYSVAVIDQGVDNTHPFLQNKVIHEECWGDCPNGQQHQWGPGSGVPCDWAPNCVHGNGVAGAIVGVGGQGGIDPQYNGIAPGAGIVSLRISSKCQNPDGTMRSCAYFSNILSALTWVYDYHSENPSIVAVNLSQGEKAYASDSYCDDHTPTYTALNQAMGNLKSINIPTIVSSGNEHNANGIQGPACVSNAIPVGAVDKQDQIGDFSQNSPFHANMLLAVGKGIYSSFTTASNGGLVSIEGTSFAAPQVAAAYLILHSADPNMDVFTRTFLLQTTGKRVYDTRSGAPAGASYVRIHLAEALKYIQGAGLTASCSGSSGTSTSCNMSTVLGASTEDKSVLGVSTGQVLATQTGATYGKMLIVAASYQTAVNSSVQVYKMNYCNYPMSRLGGSLGRTSYSGQNMELWYLINPPTPPVGYCSFQAFFANDLSGITPADPGQRNFTGAVFTDVLQNDFIAGSVRRAGYDLPPGSSFIDLTDVSAKDTRFICSYVTFSNTGLNIVTPQPSNDSRELLGSHKVYKNIQTAIGASDPRASDNQSMNIRWNSTQKYPWAATCINLKVKPFVAVLPTPTPLPPSVDLKVNGSDGPVNISTGTPVNVTWNATYATNNCAGSWTTTVLPQTGSAVIPAFTGTKTFSILCVGTDLTTRSSDAVTVTVTPAITVDLKGNGKDGTVDVVNGDSLKLAWTSTIATSCTASGAWTGSKATSGSLTLNSVTTAGTYTLSCSKSGLTTQSDSIRTNIVPYDRSRCFDRTTLVGTKVSWSDLCRGVFSLYQSTSKGYVCPIVRNTTPTFQDSSTLTGSELKQYNAWKADGKPQTLCQGRKDDSDPTFSPPTTGSDLIIYTGSTPAFGEYANLDLYYKGTKVYTWTGIKGDPKNRVFSEYKYHFTTSVTVGDLAVGFSNDARDSVTKEDRNLYVDKISIDGKEYQTEAATTYSTGTYTSADGCAPGYKQSEVLSCNGKFQYNN